MDRLSSFKAQAIIFDKDGTLIDFDAMWGGWVVYLAEQLHTISGLPVCAPLCLAMGYDHANKKVLAAGKLAASPMSQLYQLTIDVMRTLGLSAEAAGRVVEQGWCIPDPVMLAKPFTDTRDLFSKFQEQNVRLAIATADDRLPTQALLEAFDIEEYLSSMVCADDGIPSKPAPDMVLTLCERMNVLPSKVMIVGDTISDMKMGRAAGAGLVVGVLSGVSNVHDLMPYADLIIDSVNDLHAYAEILADNESHYPQTGFNQDFAF